MILVFLLGTFVVSCVAVKPGQNSNEETSSGDQPARFPQLMNDRPNYRRSLESDPTYQDQLDDSIGRTQSGNIIRGHESRIDSQYPINLESHPRDRHYSEFSLNTDWPVGLADIPRIAEYRSSHRKIPLDPVLNLQEQADEFFDFDAFEDDQLAKEVYELHEARSGFQNHIRPSNLVGNAPDRGSIYYADPIHNADAHKKCCSKVRSSSSNHKSRVPNSLKASNGEIVHHSQFLTEHIQSDVEDSEVMNSMVTEGINAHRSAIPLYVAHVSNERAVTDSHIVNPAPTLCCTGGRIDPNTNLELPFNQDIAGCIGFVTGDCLMTQHLQLGLETANEVDRARVESGDIDTVISHDMNNDVPDPNLVSIEERGDRKRRRINSDSGAEQTNLNPPRTVTMIRRGSGTGWGTKFLVTWSDGSTVSQVRDPSAPNWDRAWDVYHRDRKAENRKNYSLKKSSIGLKKSSIVSKKVEHDAKV